MKLSIMSPNGTLHYLEVSEELEIENLMALVEVETGIPIRSQLLYFNNTLLKDTKSTLKSANVGPNAVITVRSSSGTDGAPRSSTSQALNQVEQLRQRLLSNPQELQLLLSSNPSLASVIDNPDQFAALMNPMLERQRKEWEEQQRQQALLSADPFDAEAQKKIEEAIRMQNVLQNLETAMEHNPEVFGRVNMLYVHCEVNGHPLKAFVDSGAQATIVNPKCAEACGLMRLLDTRFSGMAKGVGTAKILGRIHSAQISFEGTEGATKGKKLFLPCSFTVMEGRGVDLLFGLDMLRRFQACIDLEKDVLRVQDITIRFLSEHEIPKMSEEDLASIAGASSPVAGLPLAQQPPPQAQPQQQPQQQRQKQTFTEDVIATLTNLGVSREEAIAALEATQGNPDLAANLLFS